jgi:hypothetical protein
MQHNLMSITRFWEPVLKVIDVSGVQTVPQMCLQIKPMDINGVPMTSSSAADIDMSGRAVYSQRLTVHLNGRLIIITISDTLPLICGEITDRQPVAGGLAEWKTGSAED